MKRTLAALITLTLLGGILWLERHRSAPQPDDALADMPHACLDRLFQAAGRGDVAAYLDCFTGPERQRLERELAGQPPEAFAGSLVAAVSELKGRAVFELPNVDATGAGSAVSDVPGMDVQRALLAVDRVYASRTERQIYRMVRKAGVWRIHSVEAARPFQPGKPYGSPVYEAAVSPPPKPD